jgi:hypothetical protein
MAENRLTRELENRETFKRKKAWSPPSILPDPTPVPGWAFKYVRTALMGQADPTTTSARFREGWEPCKAEDHPELMMHSDPSSRFKGNIEIGGLLLCKAPEEMVSQRREYYSNQNQAQMEAVDNNFMRTNDARMPLFSEKRSTTTFGTGK